MSTMKDPYDYIEWNPDRSHWIPIALYYREEKRRRRKRTSRSGEQWIGHIYDLIALFTLAAVLATLFKLLLH
jgi:hypothetical protein